MKTYVIFLSDPMIYSLFRDHVCLLQYDRTIKNDCDSCSSRNDISNKKNSPSLLMASKQQTPIIQ